MRVTVKGFGPVDFPDSMSDKEVRDVLKQFEPKRDDTLPKLLEAIEKALKQKPQIITEQRIVEVEKQVIVKVPEIKTIKVEKVVEVVSDPTNWMFSIKRDEDGITQVIAEPFDGG